MILLAVSLVGFGYLVGSIPTAYGFGRWLRGIDLRRYGSGTVSGSMVWEHVARWAVVPVGLFDIAKGALPTWLALHLGMEATVAGMAGLAAVVGHSWPLFLNFTGGRGLSPMLGVWLVLFPPGVMWMLGSLAIGWLSGSAAWALTGSITLPLFATGWLFGSATWALAGLVTLPLLARAIGGSSAVTYVAPAMLVLTLAKRLEANRRPLPPPGPERRRVFVRRLFLDRDIISHREWIRRQPDGEGRA